MALLAKDGDVIDKEWGDFTAEMYSEGHSLLHLYERQCRLTEFLLPSAQRDSGQRIQLYSRCGRRIDRFEECAHHQPEPLHTVRREQQSSTTRSTSVGVIDLCHKVQLAYNENLKELQKHGMLPLFDAGYINMGRQYLTIGVNGLVEAAEFMGLKITDNPDYLAFVQTVLGLVEKYNVQYRTKDVLFNCEMIPAENVGVKHAKSGIGKTATSCRATATTATSMWWRTTASTSWTSSRCTEHPTSNTSREARHCT